MSAVCCSIILNHSLSLVGLINYHRMTTSQSPEEKSSSPEVATFLRENRLRSSHRINWFRKSQAPLFPMLMYSLAQAERHWLYNQLPKENKRLMISSNSSPCFDLIANSHCKQSSSNSSNCPSNTDDGDHHPWSVMVRQMSAVQGVRGTKINQ